VQLIEVDPVEAQPAQAALAGESEVFRITIFNPLVGTSTQISALGGYHQACRIRVQSLGNDLFAHSRAIGVSRVYEIDTQFDCASQNTDSLITIRGLTPDSIARNSHCTKS
jgi:hypothetical protein